jgi:hypothetical protein
MRPDLLPPIAGPHRPPAGGVPPLTAARGAAAEPPNYNRLDRAPKGRQVLRRTSCGKKSRAPLCLRLRAAL